MGMTSNGTADALRVHMVQVHEETTAYRETLQFFEAADALTWEGLVAVKRKDLTTGFFEFLTSLVDAAHKDKARQEGSFLPAPQLVSINAVGFCNAMSLTLAAL